MNKEEIAGQKDFSIALINGIKEKCYLPNLVEGYAQPYFRVTKDFHPDALKIPNFAGKDQLTGIIYISESVPRDYRDIWAAHEYKCMNLEYRYSCARITRDEIQLLQRVNYTLVSGFLEYRIQMMNAIVKHFPEHPRIACIKASLQILKQSHR